MKNDPKVKKLINEHYPIKIELTFFNTSARITLLFINCDSTFYFGLLRPKVKRKIFTRN